jgi:hypothetical protein
MTRFLRWTALALCVSAAMLGVAPPAPAQRVPSIPFAYRADAFRRILYELGLQPLRDFKELRQDPQESLVVVLGQTDCLNRRNLPKGLKDFVEQGGAVLVATDRAPGDEADGQLQELAGVTVSGQSYVGQLVEQKLLYREKPFCPLLDSKNGAIPNLFRSPSRMGPSADLSIATNAPSCLDVLRRWDFLDPVAWLPAGSFPEGNPFMLRHRPPRSREPLGKGPLFAVGGEVGQGRALVLADHSIFINEMMIPEDNKNAEFAWNCLQWLQGEGKQRHQALFVEEGTIYADFKVPLKEGPGLPPGAIDAGVALLERTLAKLEDRGALDAAVLDQLGVNHIGGLDRLLRRTLVVLTVLLLLYLGYRVGIRGRFRLDAAVPLLAHEVARHAPAAPLLEQRRRSALQAGNLWETAHGLARQWAASLPVIAAGGTPAPQGPCGAGVSPAREGGASAPPRVVVRGGWRQRFGLRRRFRRLWRLAHDTAPVRVRPRALRRLLRDLDELKAALADGTLRLER